MSLAVCSRLPWVQHTAHVDNVTRSSAAVLVWLVLSPALCLLHPAQELPEQTFGLHSSLIRADGNIVSMHYRDLSRRPGS